MDNTNGGIEYYDLSELLSSEGADIVGGRAKTWSGLKNPEEIDLSDFISMLKESAETDNEKARHYVHVLTDLIEKDEINYWKLSPEYVVDLIQYAGYTEVDDMKKAFHSIHSREKFDKFMEERRKNSFLGKLVSRISSIINPKADEATHSE